MPVYTAQYHPGGFEQNGDIGPQRPVFDIPGVKVDAGIVICYAMPVYSRHRNFRTFPSIFFRPESLPSAARFLTEGKRSVKKRAAEGNDSGRKKIEGNVRKLRCLL
jgi:hypothetical protein